jgi:nitroreductase
MTERLPDQETIQTALSLATRAPSINDSQPWLWRIGAEGLHLYSNLDRDDAGTGANSRDVLLSCGASLHHCVVAFAALGWRAKVQRLTDAAKPDHLATVELYRHPASALDVTLAVAIPKRRSDWRRYSSWPVSAADLALIAARAARAGVTTRRVEALPEVQHAVAQAVWRCGADNTDAVEPTTRSGRYSLVADVSQWSTPRPDPTVSVGSSPFVDLAGAHQLASKSGGDNAAVLALGTKDDSRLGRLRAGEAMSMVLLSATALGLASCPVGEPLAAAETRDSMRANLFEVVGCPQMLVRIGWPPVDADPLPSPPRRPLVDVCEWLDHQSLTSA